MGNQLPIGRHYPHALETNPPDTAPGGALILDKAGGRVARRTRRGWFCVRLPSWEFAQTLGSTDKLKLLG